MVTKLTGCEHPLLAGTTGYRYGCRCERCALAKSDMQKPGAQIKELCIHDDCTTRRRRYSRYCEEHQPKKPKRACHEHGCTAPVADVKHAQFCTEHMPSPCEWCGSKKARSHRYTPLCAECRAPFKAIIRRAREHGVQWDTVLGWIRQPNCSLCCTRLNLTSQNRPGRDPWAIDHDHTHCPDTTGCTDCVRGLLCTACNTRMGGYEAMLAIAGPAKLNAYLSTSSSS